MSFCEFAQLTIFSLNHGQQPKTKVHVDHLKHFHLNKRKGSTLKNSKKPWLVLHLDALLCCKVTLWLNIRCKKVWQFAKNSDYLLRKEFMLQLLRNKDAIHKLSTLLISCHNYLWLIEVTRTHTVFVCANLFHLQIPNSNIHNTQKGSYLVKIVDKSHYTFLLSSRMITRSHDTYCFYPETFIQSTDYGHPMTA